MTFRKVTDSNLEVLETAGEVQDVSKVGFGISVGTGWLGEFQLLWDGVQLERPEEKHLTYSQQLLTWRKRQNYYILEILMSYKTDFFIKEIKIYRNNWMKMY